jgi:hypothetical protein
MRVYTVLKAPGMPQENAVFLKEGFSWPAFFLAPIVLVLQSLWLPLLGYGLAIVGLWLISLSDMVTADGILWLVVLLHFYIGLEFSHFRQWALERRGCVLEGVVAAPDREVAELRYFEGMKA